MKWLLSKSSQWWVVPLALLIGLWGTLGSVMGLDFAFIPGDAGDAMLNNCFLEHGAQWLRGQQPSFWNAPFFYPTSNVMAMSDSHLGTLPIYTAFRLCGMTVESAYQGWFVVVFVLNYVCCAWALRKFGVRPLAVAAGAFIFTFSLPIVGQMSASHSQLMPRFLVPLAFYFAWDYLRRPSSKALAACGFCCVWQLYCTIYVGYFLLLMLGSFFVAFSWMNRKQVPWRAIVGAPRQALARLGVVGVVAAMLVPLALPYMKAKRAYGLSTWETISSMLPRLESYLFPAPSSASWAWLPFGRDLRIAGEHQLFIGALPWLAVLALAVAYLRRRDEPKARLGWSVLLSLLALISITLLVDESSLYVYVVRAPGAGAIRAVSRIIVVLSFLFAVATALLFSRLQDWLTERCRPVVSFLILAVAGAGLVLDQAVDRGRVLRYSKRETQARVQRVVDEVRRRAPEARLLAYMPPVSNSPWEVHTTAIAAAQALRIPTVNGYSGKFPHEYPLYHDYHKPQALERWMESSRVHYQGQFWARRLAPGQDLFDGLVIVGEGSP